MRLKFCLLAAGMVLTSCARREANVPMEYNANIITEAEVIASGAQTAYDVVKKLRSNFVASTRGRTTINNANSPQEPVVFLDEQMFGALNTLKNIPADQVGEIRLYRAWEATTKYGTGFMAGVIAVTTRH